MFSRRWGGAFLLGATCLGAAWLGRGNGRVVAADPPAAAPAGRIVGWLDAPGVDPLRCEARCTAMRLQDRPGVRCAPLDGDGRFSLEGLEDGDHVIEIVVRANPALVVARKEYLRPGGAEVVLVSAAAFLLGPVAGAGASE